VRGALEPLAGVRQVDVTPGKREFTVVYDPSQVTPEALLQALAEKQEPARLAG
jgi:copper chaperone CopZ